MGRAAARTSRMCGAFSHNIFLSHIRHKGNVTFLGSKRDTPQGPAKTEGPFRYLSALMIFVAEGNTLERPFTLCGVRSYSLVRTLTAVYCGAIVAVYPLTGHSPGTSGPKGRHPFS